MATDKRPIDLSNLQPPRGARRNRKRVGRGEGSGTGVTAGRGHKGQQSRSGYSRKRGFEGGQMPIHRRLPKRGFHNPFRIAYEVVNLDTLEARFEAGDEVTPESLRARGLISRTGLVKVLARGEAQQGALRDGAPFQRESERAHHGGGRPHGSLSARSAEGQGRSDAMIESVKNVFAIPELRKRVLFTLGILGVYRIGSHIPTPGVNTEALQILVEQAGNTMFGLYNMFSGGNLAQATIFALGIMPYISASIILQLLTVVWPYLERLSKEGELGRRKITQYTRYSTILLCVIQSMAIAIFLERQTNIAGGLPLVYEPGWSFRLMTVLTLTTGTAFIMWLGEQITERGVGNGMSLIIFAGIVVGLPTAVLTTLDQMRSGAIGLFTLIALVVVMVLVIGAVVFIERGHRRVTVQYARRVVGRRMYGGTSTHIPLKVNTGGVIPVIFASSILAFPATAATAFPVGGWFQTVTDQLQNGMPAYYMLFVGGIIFFAYFYTAIIFNPDDVAENMRKYGGFIPGIRPGKRTAEHIDTILTRITFAGSIYLALVAVMPDLMITGFRADAVPFIGDQLDVLLPGFITNGLGVTFYFGGTSLLIIVGVSMDTVQQVESQLIMRHYDGFMKKTRIRGRRG